jgi:hypothetical protein
LFSLSRRLRRFRNTGRVAGELSPDGLFYWDGTRWVSTTSPEGAWRWDGSAWRPAGQASKGGRRSRLPWVIAAVSIVSVVLASAGVYFAGGAFIKASQRVFQSGFSVNCGSPLAQPGAALTSGDSLCGGTLGDEYLLADCTLIAGTPPGIDVWQKTYKPNESDWTRTSVSTGSSGCNLSAAPDTDVSFDSSSYQPATTVVIADFTFEASEGSVGIQLACSEEAGCVDISMFSEGLYSLDEGRPHDGWNNLTKGVSLGSTFRKGVPNRMILRLNGRRASVFLNGAGVTQASTKLDQSAGYVTFYLDNRGGSAIETVWLQRMYVFESR